MLETIDVQTFFSDETRADPQAFYNRLRETGPVHCAVGPVTGNHFWLILDYELVANALKDQRFGKEIERHFPPDLLKKWRPEQPDPAFEAINRHLLTLDPPDHTRLRGLVHKAFTPRRVAELQPRIEAIAAELLDAIGDKPDGDLIADYAFPLPITVISEMLGVNKDDRDKFKEWTNHLLFGVDQEAAQIAVMEFVQYMNALVEERIHDDKGDILSGLVHAEDNGEKLDRMELLSMIFLLLVAGHETTVNLIGNGMLALMQHRDQMDALVKDPSLVKTAVEEMLRYNGPVETPTFRWALEDVDFEGHTIKQGDAVLPVLLAANRDPAVFDEPNTFDIRRDPNPHIEFGRGIHYCVGAPLARLEGAIAINALLERYPNIRLNAPVSELKWNTSILIHGMEALPVRYR